jgi:hypothetical protein
LKKRKGRRNKGMMMNGHEMKTKHNRKKGHDYTPSYFMGNVSNHHKQQKQFLK